MFYLKALHGYGGSRGTGENKQTEKVTTSKIQSSSSTFTCPPTSGGFYPISPEGCFQHYYACADGVAYTLVICLFSLYHEK